LDNTIGINILKRLAYIVSVLTHPLFMSAYFVWMVTLLNPAFSDFSSRAPGIVLISFLGSTVLFPLIAIFMMKGLNLIESIHMREKKERVGPLLITSLFYVWSFLNFRKYGTLPEYYTFFTLGATIALFISFFITLFDKISLHTVAFSALTTGLFIVKMKYKFYEFYLTIFSRNYLINADILLAILIFLLGVIATSRLYLNEHTPKQVYTGCLVGFISMLIASMIY
jgi:hypothetical protein